MPFSQSLLPSQSGCDRLIEPSANLARSLIRRRIDFFGRGYSDAPVDLAYDIRLYTTQILLVLASSDLSWTGSAAFHLLGYSLGGAIAASFARYYPRMVRSLTHVCGGGLIRFKHVGWQSKLLYSEGIFPEWILRRLVEMRLQPDPPPLITDKPEAEVAPDGVSVLSKGSDASGGLSFDNAILSKDRPGINVGNVISWQLENHAGFVPAYMSTIRNAPIYEQQGGHWKQLGALLAERRGKGDDVPPGIVGGKMLVILGDSDPVIVKTELLEDVKAVLGDDAVEVVVIPGGHEIAITEAKEIADAMVDFWSSLL
jgi:pimeloyl-ACP methyl ester carboxylesterase